MKSQAALIVVVILLTPLSAGALSQWSTVGAAGTVVSPSVVFFSYPTGGVYSEPLAGGNGAGMSYTSLVVKPGQIRLR